MQQHLKLVRLMWVSGKGGVGKSLISAALARRCAARGERTLLVETVRPGTPSAVFGGPLGTAPMPVGEGLGLVRLDGFVGLQTWVRRRSNLGAVYGRLLNNPAVHRFLGALPGFEELLTLGQLYDFVTRDDSGWDRVIVDAPATGHFRNLLRVPATVLDTLRSGPVRENTERIVGLLTDPGRCGVVTVATPEAAALSEAREIRDFLRAVNMAPAQLLVNRLRTPGFTADERQQLAAAAWPTGCAATMKLLLEQEQRAVRQAEQVALSQAELAMVGSLPVVESLPGEDQGDPEGVVEPDLLAGIETQLETLLPERSGG